MSRPASQAELSAASALFQKKFRKETGTFLAEGIHLITDLARHPQWVEKVFWYPGEETSLPSWLKPFPESCIRLVTLRQLEKLTETGHPQPVVAIVRNPWAGYQLSQTGVKKILCLFDVQDPGNLGTLIRTAAWFGWDAVLLTPDCADWTSPKVIRSTAASCFSIPVVNDDRELGLLNQLALSHRIYRLEMDGSPIRSVSSQQDPLVLLVGNEAHGFRSMLASRIPETAISIHISGKNPLIDSLNAGVAGAIAIYDFSGN